MAAVAAGPVREAQQDAHSQGIGRHRGVLQRGHCGVLDLCTYAKHDEYSYGQYVDYGVHLKLYEWPSGHIYPTLFSSPAFPPSVLPPYTYSGGGGKRRGGQAAGAVVLASSQDEGAALAIPRERVPPSSFIFHSAPPF